MDNTKMEIENLALALQASLYPAPWLSSVGVEENDGKPCLCVYLASKMSQTAKKKLPKQWDGVPVLVKEMG